MAGQFFDTDEEQEARAEAEQELAKQLQLQETDDIRQLLQSSQFRRFIWSVLAPYVGPGDYVGDSDLLSVGKWMGERHVGNVILDKLLTADPLVYTTLYSEAYLRRKREKDLIDASI